MLLLLAAHSCSSVAAHRTTGRGRELLLLLASVTCLVNAQSSSPLRRQPGPSAWLGLTGRPVLLAQGQSCVEAGLAPTGDDECLQAAELLTNATGTRLFAPKQAPRLEDQRVRNRAECAIANPLRHAMGGDPPAVFWGDKRSTSNCTERFQCVCMRPVAESAKACRADQEPLPWPLNLTAIRTHLKSYAKLLDDSRNGYSCRHSPMPDYLKPRLSSQYEDGPLVGKPLSYGLDGLTDVMALDDATRDATFVLFLAAPRSGHSLIGSLIDAHPNALVANERDIFDHFLELRKDAKKVQSTRKRPDNWMRKQLFIELVDNSVSCGILGRYQTGHLYSVPGTWTGQWRCRIDVIGDKKGGRMVTFFANETSDPRDFEEFVDALHVKTLKVVTVLTNDDKGRVRIAAKKIRTKISWPRPKYGTTLDMIELDNFACDPVGNVRSLCSFLGLDPEEPFLSLAAGAVNTKYCNNTGTRSSKERARTAKERMKSNVQEHDNLQGPGAKLKAKERRLQAERSGGAACRNGRRRRGTAQAGTVLRKIDVGKLGTCNRTMSTEPTAPVCALTACPSKGNTDSPRPPKTVFFAHIPKTAGTSFARLLPSLISPATSLTHRERSPTFQEAGGAESQAFLATMLRPPRPHVLSQFMHCLYFRGPKIRAGITSLHDEFFQPGFPGRAKVVFDDAGKPERLPLGAELEALEAWLDRALADRRSSPPLDVSRSAPDRKTGRMEGAVDQIHFDPYMWGCYSPWNMQSRVLQLQPDEKRRFRPSWRAVEASLERYDFVGTTELFKASTCLLQAMATRRLQSDCRMATVEATNVPSSVNANETHGVPHLEEAMVPQSLMSKVDRLTAIDRNAYAWTRQQLLPKVCSLRLDRTVLGEEAPACSAPPKDRGSIPLHLLLISDQGRHDDTAALWREANPGLQVTVMDMCDGAKYLADSPMWGEPYASALRRIRYAAIKSDFIRTAYLAEHGGFYVDTDQFPGNHSLTKLVQTVRNSKKTLVLPLNLESVQAGEQVRIYNAFLAAVPRHPGFLHAAAEALNNVQKEAGGCTSKTRLVKVDKKQDELAMRLAVISIAGPVLLGRMLRQLPDVYWLEKSEVNVLERTAAGVREVAVGVSLRDRRSEKRSTASWRCTNAHWTEAVKLGSVYWPGVGHPAVSECEGPATQKPSAILVTHHKSGTVSAFSILAALCCPSANNVPSREAFWEEWKHCQAKCASEGVFLAPGGLGPLTSHETWSNFKYTDDLRQEVCNTLTRPAVPVIHFVRRPEAMVVSGHFYHLSCPEGWLKSRFDPKHPPVKRFGDAAGFAQMLAIMDESVSSWTRGNMTWCGLLKKKSNEQGVRAEALRSTLALDGPRTMLEDRRRLRQRAIELGSPYREVCNEALSSRNATHAQTWAEIGKSIHLELHPNMMLEQAHASEASVIDRERLAKLALQSLNGLLGAELQAEYPPC